MMPYLGFSADSAGSHTWGLKSSYGVFLAHYLSTNTLPGATRLDFAFIGGLSISQALLISPLATAITRLYGTCTTLLLGVFFETVSLSVFREEDMAPFSEPRDLLWLGHGIPPRRLGGYCSSMVHHPSKPRERNIGRRIWIRRFDIHPWSSGYD
jgi:hypothetical protein